MLDSLKKQIVSNFINFSSFVFYDFHKVSLFYNTLIFKYVQQNYIRGNRKAKENGSSIGNLYSSLFPERFPVHKITRNNRERTKVVRESPRRFKSGNREIAQAKIYVSTPCCFSV